MITLRHQSTYGIVPVVQHMVDTNVMYITQKDNSFAEVLF